MKKKIIIIVAIVIVALLVCCGVFLATRNKSDDSKVEDKAAAFKENADKITLEGGATDTTVDVYYPNNKDIEATDQGNRMYWIRSKEGNWSMKLQFYEDSSYDANKNGYKKSNEDDYAEMTIGNYEIYYSRGSSLITPVILLGKVDGTGAKRYIKAQIYAFDNLLKDENGETKDTGVSLLETNEDVRAIIENMTVVEAAE